MLIETLLTNFDILKFLESQGYSTKFVGSRTQYLINRCPFCEKDFHCGVNPDTKLFGCYRCGVGGNFIKLLQKILNKTFPEVLDFLKTGVKPSNIDIGYIDDAISIMKKSNMDTVESKIKPIKLPYGYVSLSGRRIPYLDKRGITNEQVNYYKIGLCVDGNYKDRLIVCDVNEIGEPIYWIARDITDRSMLKVLNPPDNLTSVSPSDILFNFSLAKNYNVGIVTEGVFDSLWIGNNGLSTYGKGLKKHHLYWLLKSNFKDVVLMYDADVKTDELEKNGILLSQFFNTRICKLPQGDPDNFDRNKLIELIQSSELFKESILISKIDSNLVASMKI